MVSIQIQNIQLKTKIQECLIIIDSKSFKVFYQNNNYIVSPEQEINEQKNNAVSNDSNSATSNIVESSENKDSVFESKKSNLENELAGQLATKKNQTGLELALAQQLK